MSSEISSDEAIEDRWYLSDEDIEERWQTIVWFCGSHVLTHNSLTSPIAEIFATMPKHPNSPREVEGVTSAI